MCRNKISIHQPTNAPLHLSSVTFCGGKQWTETAVIVIYL